MYNDIGHKVKIVAKVFCWLGIIVSVAAAVSRFSSRYGQASGILLLLIGPLTSWLASLTMYGFGQLVENSDAIREQTAITSSENKS